MEQRVASLFATPDDADTESVAVAPPSTAEETKDSPFPPSEDDLGNALNNLKLEDHPPESMFRSLSSILQACQMHEGLVNPPESIAGGDIWAVLRRAEQLEKDGVKDVPSLQAVKKILDRMLRSSSQLLQPATQIIADASREGTSQMTQSTRPLPDNVIETWRRPLGESGMLEFGLAVMSSNTVSEELQTQALRLVGNACADTGEAFDFRSRPF